MHSNGDNFYDSFKDRRYAALFWSTLMIMIGVLVLGASVVAILSDFGMQDQLLEVLPGIGILAVVWGSMKFRQAYLRGREKAPRGPLSRDEVRVARSKLRNGMKPINRPALRTPDIDLKY